MLQNIRKMLSTRRYLKAFVVFTVSFSFLMFSIKVLKYKSLSGEMALNRDDIDLSRIQVRSFGDLVGTIWPKPGSLDDRIVNQMNLMKDFAGEVDNSAKRKIILRVGDFNFYDLHWKDGQERLELDNCPIKSCWYTSTRSFARIADALLISQFDSSQLQYYTPKPKNQIWITQHLESPHHNRLDPKSLGNLVNWSVSFRQESTIALPYGVWVKRNDSDVGLFNDSNRNYAEGKTKKVAWFVSNCDDRNGRRGYANELKKYIRVDIYGACGSLSCPIVRGNVKCYAMLKKTTSSISDLKTLTVSDTSQKNFISTD